jgi:putative Mg2+ transporter-C (MgtC) family protein
MAVHSTFVLALIAGEGWRQVAELALAFALSSLIGLEREVRQKSAGLRTHTLVGTGAALFLIVSKYGFGDVLAQGQVVLDPSRVAAGIVAGIGFIGGGLIFVRRDTVRGLTTAAIIWITAAIGMACGAGLFVLALVATASHFIVVLLYPELEVRLPRTRATEAVIRIVYRDDPGILRAALATATRAGFAVTGAHTRQDDDELVARNAVEVTLEVHGAASPSLLATDIQMIPGVVEVRASETGDAA